MLFATNGRDGLWWLCLGTTVPAKHTRSSRYPTATEGEPPMDDGQAVKANMSKAERQAAKKARKLARRAIRKQQEEAKAKGLSTDALG